MRIRLFGLQLTTNVRLGTVRKMVVPIPDNAFDIFLISAAGNVHEVVWYEGNNQKHSIDLPKCQFARNITPEADLFRYRAKDGRKTAQRNRKMVVELYNPIFKPKDKSYEKTIL